MAFVIGGIIALLVIFLLAFITVKRPVFGEVTIALAVLMVLSAVFFYFQKDNREENKKHLIPLKQIVLNNFHHEWAYGNYYKLTANLTNQSQKYRLRSIELKLSFLSCPASIAPAVSNPVLSKVKNYNNCQLISHKNHTIDSRLAAQQSADIESYFLLEDEQVLALINTQQDKSIYWKVELLNGVAR